MQLISVYADKVPTDL